MTARVLVVDDIAQNVRLLQAQLAAEHFQVITALSGAECLARMDDSAPDIVLLDVMMPVMNGFEVCRRIKADPKMAHVPVVMVTALHQPEDRVAGLEAGADDFLSKPVDTTALFARVRNLVRLKMMMDELHLRAVTGQSMGRSPVHSPPATEMSRILLVSKSTATASLLCSAFKPPHVVACVNTQDEALAYIANIDLVVVGLGENGIDGLMLCAQLRSHPKGRSVPILVVASDGDRQKLVEALEMGVDDYLTHPFDENELLARIRTQLRKKGFADRARQNVELSIEVAITDRLTGLRNRRYLSRHLDNLIAASTHTAKTHALLLLDIDFFDSVNERCGRDVGDYVLKAFGARIVANIRKTDVACRYGGAVFAVVMPDTDIGFARSVAERLRMSIETTQIAIDRAPGKVSITTSVGIAASDEDDRDAAALLDRADQALRRARRAGRNRVVAHAA